MSYKIRPILLIATSWLWLVSAVAVAADKPDAATKGQTSTPEKVLKAVERGASAAVTGVERGVKAAASGIERGAKAAGRAADAGAKKLGVPGAGASAPK